MKQKTFIIAEAGVNHNGSLDMAKDLIDIAAASGADAVKFQTFRAERLVTRNTPKASYQLSTTDPNETQFDMIKKLELGIEDHEILVAHAQARNVEFLSTPFDEESVELLVNLLNLPRLKLSSGEVTNGPLLLKAASTEKPIILSTGMSTLGEIEEALGVLAFGYLNSTEQPSLKAFRAAYASKRGQELLQKRVTLLHCTTAYPAPFNEINLRALRTLKEAFGLSTGYSDHTEGIAVAIAAVAMGAKVIEKHFTISKDLPGPDHRASLEPMELNAMIQGIRQVEDALGSAIKSPTKAEMMNRSIAGKSLVALDRIKKESIFTPANLGVKRPGTGISPMCYWDIIGKKAKKNYEPDEIL